MRLLAGDVGGTKTILALVESGAITRQQSFASGQFLNLGAIVKQFLGSGASQVARACFGVAGPVSDGSCRATNLPWVIEARALARELGLEQVSLVNDFHALAVGIGELPQSDLMPLNDVPPNPSGPWVVLGAGTGLGEAVVIKGPVGLEVLSSEGGHADFAPRNDLEIDLLRFLLKRHARVSWERVVSGPGLVALHEFLTSRQPPASSRKVLDEIEAAAVEDAPAIISKHGLAGDDPVCTKALDLFASIYGAEAGNLALKVVARGGVYVAGGIAPKILSKLLDGTFLKAFLAKGRLSPVLERTPVSIVLNPDAGLIGAAAIASKGA